MKKTTKIDQEYSAQQKKKLEKYQKGLEQELSLIGKKGKKGYKPSFPQYGSNEEDNILEMEDFAENLSIEAKLNRLLKNTKRAIKRIDAGKYGICVSCRKQIKKGRLDIYPLATNCIGCAKKKPKTFWKRVWPFKR